MGEQRINYICYFCGEKERRRISKGEPPQGICQKNEEGGSHLWVDCAVLDEETRLWIKKQKPMRPVDMYRMGCYYAMQNIGAYNMAKAVQWYKKAAELGNEDAMIALYLIHDTEKFGVQDQSESLKWLQKSVSAGNLFALLCFAYDCEYVSEKKRRNIERYLAEKITSPPSFMIGGCCGGVMWDGFITDVLGQTDENTSYGMIRRGFAYEHGIAGVEKNDEEALAWYWKAYEAGDTFAMFSLGKAYDSGLVVPQDEDKAGQFYRMAIAKEIRMDNKLLPEWIRDIKQKIIKSLPNMSLENYMNKFIPAIWGNRAASLANEVYFKSFGVEYRGE